MFAYVPGLHCFEAGNSIRGNHNLRPLGTCGSRSLSDVEELMAKLNLAVDHTSAWKRPTIQTMIRLTRDCL